jgi:hypothetical protein
VAFLIPGCIYQLLTPQDAPSVVLTISPGDNCSAPLTSMLKRLVAVAVVALTSILPPERKAGVTTNNVELFNGSVERIAELYLR